MMRLAFLKISLKYLFVFLLLSILLFEIKIVKSQGYDWSFWNNVVIFSIIMIVLCVFIATLVIILTQRSIFEIVIACILLTVVSVSGTWIALFQVITMKISYMLQDAAMYTLIFAVCFCFTSEITIIIFRWKK